MEYTDLSRQVATIVKPSISTTELKIEHPDQDDCAFFATEAAVSYFTDHRLEDSDRLRMKQERDEINKLLDGKHPIGFREAATFAMILPRLKTIGVEPTQIITSSDKVEVIDTLLNEFGIEIKSLSNDGDNQVSIELPAIFIFAENGKPEATHGWFCPDADSYTAEMEKPRHTKDYPDLQAVVSIDKVNSNS